MPILDLDFEDGQFVLNIRFASDQTLRLVLDQSSVERFAVAAIAALAEHASIPAEPRETQTPLIDYLVDSLATGVDGDGLPLIQAEIENLRPIRLRFTDGAARLVVQAFSETLSSPADVRRTQKPN